MRDRVAQVQDLKDGELWRIDLELRDEELKALGHVAAQWGFLENLMAHLAQMISAGLNEPIGKGFESDSFRQRNRAIKALARKIEPVTDREALINLLDSAGSLQGERQRLIHGMLEWNQTDKDTLNVHTHKNPGGHPWVVKAADIEAIAIKIARLNCQLWNWPNKTPWESIMDEVKLNGAFVSGQPRDPGITTKTPSITKEQLSPEARAFFEKLNGEDDVNAAENGTHQGSPHGDS